MAAADSDYERLSRPVRPGGGAARLVTTKSAPPPRRPRSVPSTLALLKSWGKPLVQDCSVSSRAAIAAMSRGRYKGHACQNKNTLQQQKRAWDSH